MEDRESALRRQQPVVGAAYSVLMLDVDGVLNSAEMLTRIPGCFDRRDWIHMLDQAPCDRLERVLSATGAKIVLSSSWRVMQTAAQMTVMLRRRGVLSADVIDVTPKTILINDCHRRLRGNRCAVDRLDADGSIPQYGQRGHEIAKWLSLHPEVTRFAIVDDNSDMAHLHDRFVQTTWAEGMLDEHAERLIEMLGRSVCEKCKTPASAADLRQCPVCNRFKCSVCRDNFYCPSPRF